MDNYRVVESNELRSLVERVNELIGRGYTPIGSLVINTGHSGYLYYQPLLRMTKGISDGENS